MKFLILSGALLLATGCSSFTTSSIDRLDNHTIVVNPDSPIKGVPVSIRVPTHLELSVIETTYWERKDSPGKGGKPALEKIDSCRLTRSVEHNVKETEKIFVVDPKKPGAGLLNYGFTFQSNTNDKDAGKGYLKKVVYKADDKTITTSATLLNNTINLLSALPTGANDPQVNSDSLIATDRAVAFARFDINSPTFESDVAGFLELHLNCEPTYTCTKTCTEISCK